MEQINYGNIRIGVADEGRQMLSALKQVLQGFGFRNLTATQNLADIEGSLVTNSLDIIICDADMGNGGARDLITRVRKGELGNNPFVKFMLVLSSSNMDVVQGLMGCGADDLLIRPITAADLSKRLFHLSRDRKPFVVTFDYIGPDRREKTRPGTLEIPKIEVPNIILLKTRPDFKQHLLTKQINQAREKITLQLIERQAHQVSYRVEKAIESLNSEIGISQIEMMHTHLSEMVIVAEKLLPDLIKSVYAQEDIIVNTAVDVANRILKSAEPDLEDVKQLEKMSALILKSFGIPHQDVA